MNGNLKLVKEKTDEQNADFKELKKKEEESRKENAKQEATNGKKSKEPLIEVEGEKMSEQTN